LNSVVIGTRNCGNGANFCNGLPVTLGQLSPNYTSLTLAGVRLPVIDQTITSEREAAQGHIVAARNADIQLTGTLSNRGSTIEAGERLSISATSLNQSARADVRRTITEQVNSADLNRFAGELARIASQVGLSRIAPQGASRVSVQSVPGTLGQLISGSQLELTLDSLNNPGQVRSLGDARVNVANALTNAGSVIAHQDLWISAGSLSNNRGQILAGRDGDIRISGQLLNDAGIIETGRDLTVAAGSFINRRGPLTTSHINYGDAAPANAVNCRHEHGYCEGTAQVESTGPAQLNATRNLTLSAQSFLNDASLVSAGANLDIEAQSAATNATRLLVTSWHGHWREWRGWLRGYKDHDEFGQSVTGQTPAVIQAGGQVTLHAPTLTNSGNVQGNSVYLGGGAITNGITDFSHQTPGSTLPDSGISLANSALFGSSGFSGKLGDSLLFAPQANGNSSQFVYSRPPAPPNLISLTQEDLLNALPEHLRPGGSNPPKFLLDPQGEAQALRQAALEQTGRAYFVNGLAYDDQLGYSLDTQQRQVLYANAAQFASTYDIAFGEAITSEQIAKLTQPILWYVDQQVTDASGNQIHAYVPTVYLPQVMQGQLANIAGGVIRGSDVTLSTRDESPATDHGSQILNTGFITAARNLILDTQELRNEKRSADIGEIHQAEEDGYFKLTGNTVQPGGFLSAANLTITADKVHSLSGEFQVVGESEADTQEKSAAFMSAMRERLGDNFTEATNQDHISSEWVQVSKPDPWAKVVVVVVAVVVSIYTAGAASALIASATNAAVGSTLAVGGLGNVMLTSALTSMASSAVTGALTGHLSLNDVLIAGVTGAATGFVGAETGAWGAAKEGSSTLASWGGRAASVAAKAGTQAAFNQIRGGDLGSSFTNALISGFAAEGANAIGGNFPGGSVSHVALHGLLGAATAALQKQDIVAGAIGEATSAYLTSQIADPKDQYGNPRAWNDNEKALMSAGAMLAGAAASAAAGRDPLTAANTALTEVQNNRLLHPKRAQAALQRLDNQGKPEADGQIQSRMLMAGELGDMGGDLSAIPRVVRELSEAGVCDSIRTCAPLANAILLDPRSREGAVFLASPQDSIATRYEAAKAYFGEDFSRWLDRPENVDIRAQLRSDLSQPNQPVVNLTAYSRVATALSYERARDLAGLDAWYSHLNPGKTYADAEILDTCGERCPQNIADFSARRILAIAGTVLDVAGATALLRAGISTGARVLATRAANNAAEAATLEQRNAARIANNIARDEPYFSPIEQLHNRLEARATQIRTEIQPTLTRPDQPGNIAVAAIDVPGLPAELKAFSRYGNKTETDVPGYVSLQAPEERVFTATQRAGDPVPRQTDTEFKILDDVARRLGPNREASGTIDLFTERPPCVSCNNVIRDQFKARYPSIDLRIHHGDGSLIRFQNGRWLIEQVSARNPARYPTIPQ
jgi:filamentous hemagglutinin